MKGISLLRLKLQGKKQVILSQEDNAQRMCFRTSPDHRNNKELAEQQKDGASWINGTCENTPCTTKWETAFMFYVKSSKDAWIYWWKSNVNRRWTWSSSKEKWKTYFYWREHQLVQTDCFPGIVSLHSLSLWFLPVWGATWQPTVDIKVIPEKITCCIVSAIFSYLL